MRAIYALLPLLFLLTASAAEIPFQVNYLAGYIVPNGTNYSVGSSAYHNQRAYVLYSERGPYAVLVPTLAPGKFAPLKSQSDIADALAAYYYSSGYSPQAADGLDAIHEKIAALNASRKKGEGACRVLLGTDRHECVDFLSCQKACYSVTSFCLPVALGAGRPFIDTAVDFENSSRRLDAAYLDEANKFAAWKSTGSAGAMWNYLYSVSRLSQAAYSASQSQLFTDYSYCFMPDYSFGSLAALQSEVQAIYQNTSRFYNLQNDAAAAAQYSAEGMARQQEAEAAFDRSVQERVQAALLKAEIASNKSAAANLTAKSADGKGAAPFFANALVQQAPGQSADSIYLSAIVFFVSFLGVISFTHFLRKRNPGGKQGAPPPLE